MTTILISVAIIAMLLAFCFGRMSKQNDVKLELLDIEVEGGPLESLEDVRRVMSRLSSDKEGLITDNNQLRNSNNAYQKNIQQLKDDYYKVMSQLRDKRDELSKLQDQFDKMSVEHIDVLKQLNDKLNECIQPRDYIRLLRKYNNLL